MLEFGLILLCSSANVSVVCDFSNVYFATVDATAMSRLFVYIET